MSVGPQAAPSIATPWVPLWPLGGQTLGELAYGEFVAPVTCPATTEAAATLVVSTPAITLDGLTPIVIDAYVPVVWFSDSPDAVGFLFEDSTSLGAVWGYSASRVAVGTNHGFIRVSRRLTPAAGTHTYSFRARVSSGAGVQMIGGPGGPNQYTPGYIRVSLAAPISNAPVGALMPVQYGTTLPGSPVNGQEAILVDSLTAPTFQWRFRYNANSASAYKWEFVGGAPKELFAAATDTLVNTTSWNGFPTDVAIGIPRAGDYDVYTSARMYTDAAVRAYVAAWQGSLPDVNTSPQEYGADVRGVSGWRRMTGLNTFTGLQLVYTFSTAPASSSGSNKQIKIVPVRLA